MSLAKVTAQVAAYQPRKHWWRRWSQRAAVTAVLSDLPTGEEVSLLFMRRTERPQDPWSGQMSFPGGRRDVGDRHVFDTAVRELAEETGLNILSHGDYVGRLSDVMARPRTLRRRPLVVTPFVFQLNQPPTWNPDPQEVAELVWVPLPFLRNPSNRTSFTWTQGKMKFDFPCYNYEGRNIWGLTLKMVDELLALLA
jgi:8-oxo-dGTP pyrophosphatase MutT (NUDIX family)